MTPATTRQRLLKAAKHCKEAYSSPPQISNDYHGTKIHVGYTHAGSVVTLKGTQITANDVFTDLRIKKRDILKNFSHPGSIHRGFYDSASAVLGEVKRWCNPSRPVILCGHSQGAAEATVLAFLLHHNGYQIAEVNLFGSPRTGDVFWANSYDHDLKAVTINVQNHRDPVVRVPPRFLNYRHVGQLAYLSRGGELWTNGHSKNFRVGLDRFIGLFKDLRRPGIDALRYHKIESYLEILKNV